MIMEVAFTALQAFFTIRKLILLFLVFLEFSWTIEKKYSLLCLNNFSWVFSCSSSLPVRENCKLRYHLLISRSICKISDFNLLIRSYEVSYLNSWKSVSIRVSKIYVKYSQSCPSTINIITSKFHLCILSE